MALNMTALLKNITSAEAGIHAGGTITWSIEKELIDYLESHLRPNAKTAETGIGISTLLFASKQSDHTVIAPNEDEFQRICSMANRAGISTDTITFLCGNSEEVLPNCDFGDLDVALIDGGHGFPVPFVDWMFLAKKLRVGGWIIVDDIQIWTGEVLRDFMAADHAWRHVRTFGKAVIFQKLTNDILQDWGGQPYVVSQSEVPKDWPWLSNISIGLSSRLLEIAKSNVNLSHSDLRNTHNLNETIKLLKMALIEFEDLWRKTMSVSESIQPPEIHSWDNREIITVSVMSKEAPWYAERISEYNIPGMITLEEKKYYSYLPRFYSSQGAIVELGPWLGASTACLLDGLKRNQKFHGKKLHVFDDFVWRSSWMDQYVQPKERLALHSDFRTLFERYAGSANLAHMIVRKVKICDYDGNESLPPLSWNDGPIEMLFVDCGRTFEVNEAWFRVLAPHFIPGRTLIVMQDWRLWREIPEKWFNQTKQFTDSKSHLIEEIHEVSDGGIATFLYKGK